MKPKEYKDKGFALVDADSGEVIGWCNGRAVKNLVGNDIEHYRFVEVSDEEADRIQDDNLSLKDLTGRPMLSAVVKTKVHLI